MFRLAAAVLGSAMVLGLAACASKPHEPKYAEPKPVYVLMSTTAGDIVLELDEARAPVSVKNFLAYAEKGAYDGTAFHRVMPGFVIQGGGYTKELVELPSDPPIHNEWGNGLKNTRGTVAMARDTEPDTATREFYINLVDNAKLDQRRPITGDAGYAVFGHVVAGMKTVDAIAAGETAARPDKKMENVPVRPVVVVKVIRLSDEEARRAIDAGS